MTRLGLLLGLLCHPLTDPVDGFGRLSERSGSTETLTCLVEELLAFGEAYKCRVGRHSRHRHWRTPLLSLLLRAATAIPLHPFAPHRLTCTLGAQSCLRFHVVILA